MKGDSCCESMTLSIRLQKSSGTLIKSLLSITMIVHVIVTEKIANTTQITFLNWYLVNSHRIYGVTIVKGIFSIELM